MIEIKVSNTQAQANDLANSIFSNRSDFLLSMVEF